jgi:C1A family cysteine protease
MNDETLDIIKLQATLQQKKATWIASETPLTALTRQEKQLRLGAEPPAGELTLDEREQVARINFQTGTGIKAIGAPASYDLRNVGDKNFITSVKNQGSCGSCVAFGSVATVEGTARVKNNDPNLVVDLSEAHLFYCHAAAQGRNCSNGWWVDPALDAFKNPGVVDDTCYPYTPGDQQCGVCSDWLNRVTKISAWSKLTTIADMKTWLSTNGPLAACFKVYDDFYAYRSGIYHHVTGDFLGGHCVCVIGYSDSDKCWICKNSWGTNWGENGFFRIAYGDCGIDFTMWGVDIGIIPSSVWLEKKLITGLWSISQERKAAAYVDGIGWRYFSTENDSAFLGMLTLLASAKASKALVNLRIEKEVIKEIYVF